MRVSSMDICNINNNPSGHFDTETMTKTAPSIIGCENVASGKFENRLCGKKRKTRRFKSRYKCKSDKKSKYVLKKMRNRVYPQSEAPYNTNQFLMADHNNVENLDDKLAATRAERSRNRESSFISGDSDEDQFYSSPEDEDEFLTKDFVDTYQTVCAEKFGNLTKGQLTKIIFELEAKVDELSKNCRAHDCASFQPNGIENKELRIEVKDILKENERLRNENMQLKEFIKEHASMVSSSSSSSSSGDSGSDSGGSDEGAQDKTC